MTQVECFTLCKPRKPIVIGLSLNPGQKLFDPNRPTFGPDDLRLPISSSEFSTLQLLVIALLIHCHSTSYKACNIHCAYSWFLSYSYGIWCICIGRNISYIIYHRTLYILGYIYWIWCIYRGPCVFNFLSHLLWWASVSNRYCATDGFQPWNNICE